MLIKCVAGKRLGEDVLNLILRRRHVHHVVQRVIRSAATKLMGDVIAKGDGALEVCKRGDGDVGHICQTAQVAHELTAAFDAKCCIRTHSGNNLHVEGGVGSDLLVPLKAICRVIGGADHADIRAANQLTAGEIVLCKLGVGQLPYLLSGLGVEHALIAKETLELQVAPLKNGVANATLQGLRPLLELLASRGVTGDKALVHAVGTHKAPLVVVAAQPDLGDGFKTLVLENLLGGNMAVIVNNGHVLRIGVE